jgi:hypothetical protein
LVGAQLRRSPGDDVVDRQRNPGVARAASGQGSSPTPSSRTPASGPPMAMH